MDKTKVLNELLDSYEASDSLDIPDLCERVWESAIAHARPQIEAEAKAEKDNAYLERNKCVSALTKLFPSVRTRTAIEGWSDDWHGCVYITFPTGQVSWHFHDSHAYLFAHVPAGEQQWDGHTTEEKYSRLDALPDRSQIEAAARAAAVEEVIADVQTRGVFQATAIRAISAAPAGFVCVPVEPTEEMIYAADKHSKEWSKTLRPLQPLNEETWRDACIGRYKAMLAAARPK